METSPKDQLAWVRRSHSSESLENLEKSMITDEHPRIENSGRLRSRWWNCRKLELFHFHQVTDDRYGDLPISVSVGHLVRDRNHSVKTKTDRKDFIKFKCDRSQITERAPTELIEKINDGGVILVRVPNDRNSPQKL